MIILRLYSDKENYDLGKHRKLLNDVLTSYMKGERRSKKKKEIIGRIKDITNDPEKLKKGAIIAGLSTLGAGTVIAGSISGRKRIKRKIDEDRSNEKVKRSISENKIKI